MKENILFIIAGLCIAALTGCGQKAALYGASTELDGQEDVWEKETSGNLRDLLGMGEERLWEETIEGQEGRAKIKAEIKIPDTANLYTMTATKYYLTLEDKKKIAEYFMDADTIKVDKDLVTTKEHVQRRIDEQQTWIEELVSSNANEETIAYEEQYKEKLEEKLKSVPNYDDIEEEPGDYSADYYIGNKGSERYRIAFGQNWGNNFHYEEDFRNIFSWSLGRIEYSDEEIEKLQSNADNDKMTEDKACLQAKWICGELGLSDMSVVYVITSEPSDEEFGPRWTSYMIELVRNINGVPLDGNIYCVEHPYLEEESTIRPYAQERVQVIINNLGLASISYEGSMKTEEIRDVEKILCYSQIQESFRKELETMESEEDDGLPIWRVLELSYMRVIDESNPNLFCYIPVWRLCRQKNDERGLYSTKDNIWINGIDGNRIYPEEVGAARFEVE